MESRPHLRVLFFDVFGTCVAQRRSVADELWPAAQKVLWADNSPISEDVSARVNAMTYGDWLDFADEWNRAENDGERKSIVEKGNVDWRVVDEDRINALPRLLAKRGLVSLREGTSGTKAQVEPGSLWDDKQLERLGRVWHRLSPWYDVCRGIELLNKRFITVALSNTYNELLTSLVAHGKIPFTHVYSSDMFDSYKPNPKVYLGAAEKLGVKPEECALVAAHLNDLKGAKACGFYAISVERPFEEKNPELRSESIPDMCIALEHSGEDAEDAFLVLAERLGVVE